MRIMLKGVFALRTIGVCIVLSLTSCRGIHRMQYQGTLKTMDDETQFAWNEYESLVHPQNSDNPPVWVNWFSKCDAGLTASCGQSGAKARAHMRTDAAAAEIPRQVAIDFASAQSSNKQNTFVAKFARAPQLASVLFDPNASHSIQKHHLGESNALNAAIHFLDQQHLKGSSRELPTDTFTIDSEIVKLMWRVIPASDKAKLNVYLENVTLTEGDYNRLPSETDWGTAYHIDPDPKKSCPATLPSLGIPGHPAVPATPVPISCFYSFPIRGGEGCAGLGPDVRGLWCQPEFKQQPYYAVLVGFHVMKLTQDHPEWMWMTFYWTRETNETETPTANKWPAPWNRFHVATTTKIRELASAGHQICSNPYLEGSEINGLKDNCLSCHSFAAYSPTESKKDSGVGYGDSYPYTLKQRKKDENCYFDGAVQTSFAWSISTNQDPSTNQVIEKFRQQLLDELIAE